MRVNRLSDLGGSNSNQGGPGQGMLGGPAPDGEMWPPLNKFLAPEFDVKTFIFAISVVQVIMFIVELIVGATMFDGAFVLYNTMAGPSGATMRFLGAKYLPDIWAGEVWRFWTPALLHGGILHIFMNGIFQFMLCFRFEKQWGTGRTAFFYFFTALGSTLLSCVCSPYNVSVGASGALFGMMGANISYICMNWHTILNPQSQLCNAFCMIFINIVIGMGWTKGNIDNWAHMGGLFTGLFMGLAFVASYCTFQSDYMLGKEIFMKRLGLVLSLIWFTVLLSITFFGIKHQ